MYEQISANKRKSIILIVFFVAFVIGAGYLFSRLFAFGPAGLVIAAALAFVMTWGSYFYSDKIVLSVSRARPLEPNEYPFLNSTIQGLAIAAGLPKPRAYIIDDAAPNAFATGRNPEKAVVAVTKGLVEKLDTKELEGVIAHEMSHIKNLDIRFMAIVSVLAGLVIIMADIFRYSMWFGGSDSHDNRLGVLFMVIGLILAIVAPLFAMLIRFAISRKREYLADASAVTLTSSPLGLANALRKLAGDAKRLKSASSATAPLFIVNPFKGSSVASLFSTHPPIEERIKRLEEMG